MESIDNLQFLKATFAVLDVLINHSKVFRTLLYRSDLAIKLVIVLVDQAWLLRFFCHFLHFLWGSLSNLIS